MVNEYNDISNDWKQFVLSLNRIFHCRNKYPVTGEFLNICDDITKIAIDDRFTSVLTSCISARYEECDALIGKNNDFVFYSLRNRFLIAREWKSFSDAVLFFETKNAKINKIEVERKKILKIAKVIIDSTDVLIDDNPFLRNIVLTLKKMVAIFE